MSEREEPIPFVSLQRTLSILLVVYGCCLLAAFLAGATLVAHVDPLSECILYSWTQGDQLYYGEEAVCESIAYLFLACVVGSGVMFYLTFRHRRALIESYKSGHFLKPNDPISKLSTKFIWFHVVMTASIILLTSSLTAGYGQACDNLNDVVSNTFINKLSNDDNLRKGEKLDERFVFDNQFWRYHGQVGNAFGRDNFNLMISCRTIFTDPDIHQRLHETHVKKYSSYFGYWYKQDLYSYDPQTEAVLTNALIEASLAGGWISLTLWVGSLVFMLIQKFYLKKEKKEMDRVSLHSGFEGGSTMRKDHESMISGYSFNRGGMRGSDTTIRSAKSARARDTDEIMFAMHGVATPAQHNQAPSNGLMGLNQTLNGGAAQNGAPRYDYPPMEYPQQQMYNMQPQQYSPAPQYIPQQNQQYNRDNGRAYLNPRNPETMQIEREHVETEIM